MKKELKNTDILASFRKTDYVSFPDFLVDMYEELDKICKFCDIKCDNKECNLEVI